MQTLQKLKSAFSQTRTNMLNGYRDLLESVAGDAEFDEQQSVEIMRAAGKSAEDLEADVELLKKRRVWAAGLREKKECKESVKTAQGELQKLEVERQQAFKKHISPLEKQMQALQFEMQISEGKIQQHWLDLKFLQDSAPNHIKTKLAKLRSEFSKISAPKSDLKNQAAAARRRIETLEREIPKQEKFVESHQSSRTAAASLEKMKSQLPTQYKILQKTEDLIAKIEIAEAELLERCRSVESELLIP